MNTSPYPTIILWEEPVEGARLLDERRDFVRQYLVLPDHAAEVIALFVARGGSRNRPSRTRTCSMPPNPRRTSWLPRRSGNAASRHSSSCSTISSTGHGPA